MTFVSYNDWSWLIFEKTFFIKVSWNSFVGAQKKYNGIDLR